VPFVSVFGQLLKRCAIVSLHVCLPIAELSVIVSAYVLVVFAWFAQCVLGTPFWFLLTCRNYTVVKDVYYKYQASGVSLSYWIIITFSATNSSSTYSLQYQRRFKTQRPVALLWEELQVHKIRQWGSIFTKFVWRWGQKFPTFRCFAVLETYNQLIVRI